MMFGHIVIFRTSGSYIDYATYNCQEVGLAKALVNKGFKVSVVMAGPVEKYVCHKCGNREVGIYYLTYKAMNQSICVFNGWKGLLERLQPDVLQVHEFGMFMSWRVARWAKRKAVRCVLIQGNYATTQKFVLKQLESLFNHTFGKSVLNMVSAIGCKTKAAVEYLARYGEVNCMLTPVGLDEDKFSDPIVHDDVKEQYGIRGKKVLLYVGVLEPRRNPIFLLEIMQGLPDDYVLLVVGEGSLREVMCNYIANNGIANVVRVGKLKQEELPALYRASDMFLLASNYEIFGMVILEAMYFGIPVLSTPTAGANTLINAATGVVLPTLDVEMWRRCITTLCENREQLSLMKEHCCSIVREKYVWDEAVEMFIKLYGFLS